MSAWYLQTVEDWAISPRSMLRWGSLAASRPLVWLQGITKRTAEKYCFKTAFRDAYGELWELIRCGFGLKITLPAAFAARVGAALGPLKGHGVHSKIVSNSMSLTAHLGSLGDMFWLYIKHHLPDALSRFCYHRVSISPNETSTFIYFPGDSPTTLSFRGPNSPMLDGIPLKDIAVWESTTWTITMVLTMVSSRVTLKCLRPSLPLRRWTRSGIRR